MSNSKERTLRSTPKSKHEMVKKVNGLLTHASAISEKKKPSSKKKINGTNVWDNTFFNTRNLLEVLTEVKNGNFSVRLPIDQVGLNGKICDTINEIISLNEKMILEFTKAGNTIGKQGKLTQRIEIPSAKGSWSTGVESLNTLISDLVHPTIEIARVYMFIQNMKVQASALHYVNRSWKNTMDLYVQKVRKMRGLPLLCLSR